MKELYELKKLYRSMYFYFGTYSETTSWFKKKNQFFDGKSPIELAKLKGVGVVKLITEGLKG